MKDREEIGPLNLEGEKMNKVAQMNAKVARLENELDMLAQELKHNVEKWDAGELEYGIEDVLAIVKEIKKNEDELVEEIVTLIACGQR